LGEDLRKIITQNNNRRLTKILSLENKIELKFLPKFWKRLKPLRTIYLNM